MVVKREPAQTGKNPDSPARGADPSGGASSLPGVADRGSRARSSKPAPEVDARGPLRTALDESVAAATHLTGRDAAAIAAARALADKIDAWDVIVDWALEDLGGNPRPGQRPAVPQNDNTSLPSFLKYLEALQLVPPAEKAKPGPASQASASQEALNEMRKGLAVVPEVG